MYSADSQDSIKIGCIGGGASAIILLAHLAQALQSKPKFGPPVEFYVFDPNGLNPGPPYRLRSNAYLLNQPAGDEMDPFRKRPDQDRPPSFLKWLQATRPTKGYTSSSFVPRHLFGDYLSYTAEEIRDRLFGALHEVRARVTKISKTQSEDGDIKYRTYSDNNLPLLLDGFILATGHVFTPKTIHPHYIAASSDATFEQRVAGLARQNGPIVLIGSGASMAENVSALESFGYRGIYYVISPHGDTGWAYHPNEPEPPTKILDRINEDIRSYAPENCGPDIHIRRLITHWACKGIAPQYVVRACLTLAPEVGDDFLAAAKAFYGNPLAPDRFNTLLELRAGRLRFMRGRVTDIAARGGQLHLTINDSSLTVPYIIDCSVVQRGIHDENGHIADPLIGALLQQKIIHLSPTHHNAIDTHPAPGEPIWAIGPPTKADRNGIETFSVGYSEVADSLLHHLQQKPQPLFRPQPPYQPRIR